MTNADKKQLSREKYLENFIYEVICDIESDFEDKLTIHDIYQKLIQIQDLPKMPTEEEILDD